MKTFKILSVILAIAASQVMTSCLNHDDNGYTINSKFSYLFNAVVTNDGEVTLYPKQSVEVNWGYGKEQLADVQIAGLILPDFGSFPILQFSDVPWKLNSKGWLDITLNDVKPTSVSGFNTDLVFNRFNLQTVNRSYNNLNFPPCINVSYTINDEYRVYGLPSEIIEVGETVVTNLESGTSFKQDDSNRSIYYIELDPSSHKGFVVIQGAQFAQNMPGMNMKFPSIPFEVNQAGILEMSSPEIEPALMTGTSDINSPGTPAPNYPITDFKAVYNPNYGVTISFICTPHTKEGVAMGTFAVKFTCEYPATSVGVQVG